MSDHKTQGPLVDRREVLKLSGAGVLAAAAGMTILSEAALATPKTANATMRKAIGNRPMKEGRIKLKLPPIAENGNTVPMTVTVDSPMTSSDYVKAIHVVSEGNPLPGVATFHLTPMSGRAEVTTRIRMARSQNVIAVAEMSNGALYRVVRNVKVAIGGCGG